MSDPASFEAQLAASQAAIAELLVILDKYMCGCGDMAPPPDGYQCENCRTATWAANPAELRRLTEQTATRRPPTTEGDNVKPKPTPQQIADLRAIADPFEQARFGNEQYGRMWRDYLDDPDGFAEAQTIVDAANQRKNELRHTQTDWLTEGRAHKVAGIIPKTEWVSGWMYYTFDNGETTFTYRVVDPKTWFVNNVEMTESEWLARFEQARRPDTAGEISLADIEEWWRRHMRDVSE